MIFSIRQTASGTAQTFDIFSGGRLIYEGALGRFSRFEPVVLSRETQALLTARPVFSHWTGYIPLSHLAGRSRVVKVYTVSDARGETARFSCVRDGFLKAAYEISLKDGAALRGYAVADGAFDHVSIYRDATQIALMEIFLTVADYQYGVKLYLLDGWGELGELLSLFVLYYMNLKYTHRFHLSHGAVHGRSWSLSRYRNFYDPIWRERHFPEENFFGKTSLLSGP